MTKAQQIFCSITREGADHKDLMRELRKAADEHFEEFNYKDNSPEVLNFLSFLEK